MNKTVAAREARNERIAASQAYYAAREALEGSSTEALEATLAAFPGESPARQAATDIIAARRIGQEMMDKMATRPIVIREMRMA